MLPVFSKARQAMRDVFGKSVFQGSWGAHPVLKELRVRPVTEGKESSYQREDGKVVETDYKLSRVERSWKFEDATGLTPESFMATASDMGKEMGNQILRGLLATVSDATEEVGNVIKCDVEGLTFEKFLEMTEKTYTEFDELGNPYKKTLLLPPEACERFENDYKAWMSDPAKRLALQQVIERLRDHFNETEARRRMVD